MLRNRDTLESDNGMDAFESSRLPASTRRTHVHEEADDENHGDARHDVGMVLQDEFVREDRRRLGRLLAFERRHGSGMRRDEYSRISVSFVHPV